MLIVYVCSLWYYQRLHTCIINFMNFINKFYVIYIKIVYQVGINKGITFRSVSN